MIWPPPRFSLSVPYSPPPPPPASSQQQVDGGPCDGHHERRVLIGGHQRSEVYDLRGLEGQCA